MDRLDLLIVAIVSVFSLSLGVMVLLRNTHGLANRLFACLTLSIVSWQIANFMCDQPAFYGSALFLNRLATAAGVVMLIAVIAFFLVFPTPGESSGIRWYVVMGALALGATATAATPWAIPSVQIRDWGTNASIGWMYYVLVALGAGTLLGLAGLMFRKFRAAPPSQRAQLGYVFTGGALDIAFLVVVGGFLPILTGNNEYAKFLPIATVVFLVPAAYAVMRHRFMDIRLAMLRTVAYAALVLVAGTASALIFTFGHTFITRELNVSDNMYFVLSCLIVGFGLQPVRRVIERWTDGVFYRHSYRPEVLLGRLGRSMVSTLETESLATLLAHELAREMRLSYAAVVYHRAASFEVSSTNGAPSESDAVRLMDLTGTEVFVADDLAPESEQAKVMAHCDARLLAPLIDEDKPIGLIVLGAKRSGGMFSEADVSFAEVLALEASIAMRNAELFQERNQRVRELSALNQLVQTIGARFDLPSMLDSAMQEVVKVTSADSGSIMLLDEAGKALTIAVAQSIDHDIVSSTRIPLGEGIAGWVAEHREPVMLPSDSLSHLGRELLRDEITSAICTPIMSKEALIGVLCVNRKDPSHPFAAENMHVVTSFAGQLGVAIENIRLYANLQGTFLGTVSALAAAVEAKDPYTFGHSNEVTSLSVSLAEALDLEPSEVRRIEIAATLHDIGKIGIDGAILLKPGRLTDEERAIVNRHPSIAADILAPLDFLRDTVPLVLFHHERFGGGGYPSGISGQAIPIGARIIAVADSFNAMISDRPYRKGLSLEAAVRELRENSGSQFDPAVVGAFLELLAGKGLRRQASMLSDLNPLAMTDHITAIGGGV